MSYQAEGYVCNLRGVSRSEKGVLFVVAHYLDQRTGIARIAQGTISASAAMSERHVRRLASALEARGVLAITRNGNGRGAVAEYRLPCMPKEDTMSAFSPTRQISVKGKEDIGARKADNNAGKEDIEPQKADICDPAIKEEEVVEKERKKVQRKPSRLTAY